MQITLSASLEDDLRDIEKQIYDLESNYMKETAQYGNVIRGWEAYRSSSSASSSTTAATSQQQPEVGAIAHPLFPNLALTLETFIPRHPGAHFFHVVDHGASEY